MTSGDGFRFGISRYYHKLNVGPADFKRYGEMRMGESRAALKTLGLAPSDITFLGYPDRGLMAMWREHWNSDGPLLSQYSRTTQVVYRDALHPASPFAAKSVLSDVVEMLRTNRPTDVYVTHPNDDHDDHSAASAFVALAVQKLKASGEPWARNIKLHYYLVHRGDWPVPQGVHPNEPLSPPAQMMACGTTWRELPLTKDEEDGKLRALNCYKSQEEMMGRFLKSFVRRTEIFGDLSTADSVMASETLGPARLASAEDRWPAFKAIADDPTSDNVVISLQKGADIRQLSAYHDGKYLYVRMDTNGSLLPEVHYVLHIRAADFAADAADKELAVTIDPRAMVDSRPLKQARGIVTEWHADHVLARIPLEVISAPTDGLVFIEGVTHFSNVPFDRTGPRPIRIHIEPQAPQAAPLT
jgi:LmbE family N-acetylglucosaminyl deacetylase